MQSEMLNGMAAPDPSTLQAMLEGVAYYAYAVAWAQPGPAADAAPIPGVDPRYPVRAIVHGELALIVSDVSLAEYDLEQLRGRLQDSVWLELLARGHQRVLDALAARYTLLPLKLCTLYKDEARITAMLAAQASAFGAALERVCEAREWGVKVFYDRAALAAWATKELPLLRDLSAKLSAASPGARYMLEKRIQRAAEQTVDDLRHREAEVIGRQLAASARAAIVSPLQSAQIHGRPDEMLLNGAYLVGTPEHDQFHAVLEGLAEQYGSRGFTFVLTGPWPAYSFSTPSGEEGP